MISIQAKFRALAILSLGLLLPVSSQADLYFVDYLTPGDHDLVVDTDTNLEWMTLTFTQGASPLGLELANPGFTFATAAQVLQLFDDAGGGFTAYDDQYRNSAPDLTTAQTMYQFFGATNTAQFEGQTYQVDLWGNILNSAGTAFDMYEISLRFPAFASPGGASEFVELDNALSTSLSSEANYMFREIPEPASALLIAAGLLILAARRTFRPLS